MDRITLIRQSLTCFGWGILGFLPVVGFIPAIWSLARWIRLRAMARDEWNPAAAYLHCGAILSLLGILGTGLVGASFVLSFC